MQRNHQKVIEEAPAPFLSEAIEKKLTEYTKTLVKEAKYTNAGTAEYLVSKDAIYFLEINSRIQVEHPVTEELFNIDLIEAQIRVARGELLNKIFPTIPQQNGHVIEARVCAENPRDHFTANSGTISLLKLPSDVRVDSGYQENDTVSYEFDSMLLKVIAQGTTRDEAIQKLIRALQNLMLVGVGINTEFLISILKKNDFQSGTFSTNTLDTLTMFECSEENIKSLYIQNLLHNNSLPYFPFRLFGESKRSFEFTHQGKIHSGIVTFPEERLYPHSSLVTSVRHNNESYLHTEDGQFIFDDSIQCISKNNPDSQKDSIRTLKSPLPGMISKILVKIGDSVLAGQTIILLESMKMEHEIKAVSDASIKQIHTSEKTVVKKGADLVTLG